MILNTNIYCGNCEYTHYSLNSYPSEIALTVLLKTENLQLEFIVSFILKNAIDDFS